MFAARINAGKLSGRSITTFTPIIGNPGTILGSRGLGRSRVRILAATPFSIFRHSLICTRFLKRRRASVRYVCFSFFRCAQSKALAWPYSQLRDPYYTIPYGFLLRLFIVPAAVQSTEYGSKTAWMTVEYLPLRGPIIGSKRHSWTPSSVLQAGVAKQACEGIGVVTTRLINLGSKGEILA